MIIVLVLAPGPPGNVQAVQQDGMTFNLSWHAAVESTGPVLSWIIRYRDADRNQNYDRSTGGDVTYILLEQLNPYTNYTDIRVSAHCSLLMRVYISTSRRTI